VHLPYPHPQPLIYIPRTKRNIGFIRPTQAITALTHIHISHTSYPCGAGSTRVVTQTQRKTREKEQYD